MRILVGWDDPAEAETIELLLNVDDNTATVTIDGDTFLQHLQSGAWDVLVVSLNFPTDETAFAMRLAHAKATAFCP